MLIGSPAFGSMADKFGRRATLITATSFMLYFGLLTAFAPSYNWVIFIRFVVGFAIGGAPQATTLYIEYLPSSVRAKGVLVMAIFWGIGGTLVAFLAWLVMPSYGWRVLVGLSTFPLFAFVLTSPWSPESPLFLATAGRESEVYTQLNRVRYLEVSNCRIIPPLKEKHRI